MDLNEMKLGDVMTLILKGSGSTTEIDMGKQIIVLHRGWVVAGHVKRIGDMVHVKDARCIRRWGRPLSELATIGKDSDTKIDSPSSESFPLLGVIKFMKIEKESDLI